MGLQSLRLSNFKSYDGELEIELDVTKFVCVVGDVGSGKSNLLDAVCFVLGMAPEQLRCTDLTDLCYTGTTSMYVEAVVDIYGHTQTFRRTPSHYSVDGRHVSASTYKQRWSRLNVFPELMNTVVQQGDIEKLAGAAPKQLAGLVEGLEAVESTQGEATAVDLRHDYELAVLEYEQARTAARVRASERTDAQDAVDEYRELRNARETYDRLSAELKDAKAQRQVFLDRARSAKLAELKRTLRTARTQVQEAREEAQLVTHDSRALRSDYAHRRRAMQAARAQEAEARATLSQAENIQGPLTHKLEALSAEQRVVAPELSFANDSLAAAKAELEHAERAVELLNRATTQAQGEDVRALGLSSEMRDLWNTLEAQFKESHPEELNRVADAEQRVNSSSLAFESLEVMVNSHADARAAADGRVRALEANASRADALVDEHAARAASYRAQLEQVSQELAEVNAELSELRPKLVENSQKLQLGDINKAAFDKKAKLMLSVDIMRRRAPGVLDLLGNLVQPLEQQFEIALENALDWLGDAIVVDTADTLSKCMAIIREQNLGSFTLMDLSDIGYTSVPSGLRARLRTSGVPGARLLIDSVTVDSQARPAAASALGDTVMVPNMEAARKLRRLGFGMHLVTLDGKILDSHNILTVESGFAAAAASARAMAALHRKTEQIAERIKAAAAREPELADQEAELNGNIESEVSEHDQAKRDAAIIKEQLSSAERERDHLAEPTEAELQRPALLEKLATSQRELEDVQSEVHKLKEEAFLPFTNEAGGTLLDWEPAFKDSSRRITDLERERITLNARLESAKRRAETAQTVVGELEQRAAVLEAAYTDSERELENIQAQIRTSSSKLERAATRMRELKSEAESKSDEVTQAEAAMDEANERVETAEAAERQALAELKTEKLSQRLRKNAHLDDDVSESRPESSQSGSAYATEDISDGDDSDSENEDDTELGDVNAHVLSVQQFEDRIQEIEAELAPLNVSEEFEAFLSQAAERYSQLQEEAAADRDDSDELLAKLEDLRRRRTATFDVALAQLQERINDVYAELAGLNAQAVLTPVNPDEPFEGVEFAIMAPGKPFAPVSQLSGGERSMAALALLFACQQLRPAPFVVLDEVDAALDFFNVGNVAQYMRAHSRSTQFIVVTHNQRLFHRADHLVGVYALKQRSNIITVPLSAQ